MFQLKIVKKKRKKDRDPTILAVTNIHTRFYIKIHEYPSTQILAAALNLSHVTYLPTRPPYLFGGKSSDKLSVKRNQY